MADAHQLNSSEGIAQAEVEQLYAFVDSNGDGQLDLKEVATLFKQLAPDQSTGSAHNAAVEALLLSDMNVDKKLQKNEFEELVRKLADNAGIPAATAAQRLLIAAKASTPDSEAKGQAQGPAATTAATEVPAESPSSKAAGSSNASSRSHAAEASRVEKLQRLFRLWDRAGDGSISFDELCQGLGKFKPVTCKKDVTVLLREAASILAAHDVNGDRRLQFDEFTAFLMKFMGAAGYKLDEVLDELLVLASKRDSRKLQAVLGSAQEQIHNVLSGGEQ